MLRSKSDYTRKIALIGVFFFLFGFITWINGALIPYLKIACQLEEWQAYLVTFSFYMAYAVMAIPSIKLLQRTGLVGGAKWGLLIMALGCLCFVPAALQRAYPLFLAGLFIIGTGLTILQTAVNPYVTLLGPPERAAQRISIMGLCNKFAGVIAPIAFGAITLRNAGNLMGELEQLDPQALDVRLDQLAHEVIGPYSALALLLAVIAWLIRFAHLPVIGEPADDNVADSTPELTPKRFVTRATTGFMAIFCSVGVEVVAGDTIGNYGIAQGIDLDVAKTLTSYTLAAMLIGYIAGTIAIPRLISQEKAFIRANIIALVVLAAILCLPGLPSVYGVALLGFPNAFLWSAIWPQALRNLRRSQLHKASAVLIMGIAGGAIVPLVYGLATTWATHQSAYVVLVPCYLYNIWYWSRGEKGGEMIQS